MRRAAAISGVQLLHCVSQFPALTDDYSMSALTVAIWGKPDQI
jgi:sialic acid synthase SpsE